MGTKRPSDFVQRTTERVQDLAGRVSASLIADSIDDAISEYSEHRPRNVVSDLLGNGTNDISLPDGVVVDATTGNPAPQFLDGFSRLDTVEFPVDQVPSLVFTDSQAYLWRKPQGLFVRVVQAKPSATDKVRVGYTTIHTWGSNDVTKSASTIPDPDFNAVCALSAAIVSQSLSQLYSEGTDPTINADFVNGTARAAEFEQRAKELRLEYDNHMGIEEKIGSRSGTSGRSATQGYGSGQAFVSLEPTLVANRSPLTHPRKVYEDPY